MLTDSLNSDLKHLLGLSQLSVQLRPEWSSTNPTSRQLIRQFIYESIEQDEQILDINTVPMLHGRGLSISHNKILGGFVHTQDNCRLGFDIESKQRLNEKNVHRFASELEIQIAVSASILWTAKEAAYKALPFTMQPTVIGEIELTNWKTIEKNLSVCQIGQVQKRPVYGYTVAIYNGDENQTIAIAKGPSKNKMDM